MKKLITFFLLYLSTLNAQIIITQSDINNIFTVGKSWLQIQSWEPQTSMNVGNTSGSSQNWIVPPINWEDTTLSINISPSGTPYQSYFPLSTHAQYTYTEFLGSQATFYAYFRLTTDSLIAQGNVLEIQTSTIDTFIVDYTNEVIFTLPLTYGYSRLVARDSIDLGEGMWQIFSRVQTGDAFGTITMPFGSYSTLRVKEVTELLEYSGGVLTNEFRITNYTWIAPGGGVFQADLDTSSVITGNVELSRASLIEWIPTTSLENNFLSLPTEYILYQNSPNPFNPITVIRYQIPESGFVTLKVYDLLGRETTTLVNEYKLPGKYEVTFNAENFASGVYLYQLTTNSYVNTKKMIITK